MNRILGALFLVGLASAASGAQWTKTWVNQGGAAGEWAEIRFENKVVPVPLNPTPNRPYIIAFGTGKPPQFFLAGGLLDANSRGRTRVFVPNHAGLLGLTVYLQGWVYTPPPTPTWIQGDLCTWIISPQMKARFIPVGPPRSIIQLGGEARARLANGQVLMCGGQTYGPSSSAASLFLPASNTVRTVGPMTVGRAYHGLAALPGGDALVVGGTGLAGKLKTAEFYDGQRGVFSPLGTLPHAVWNPLAVPVRHPITGKDYVLVAGGLVTSVSDKALLYDVQGRTFSTLPRMVRPRVFAAAVALPGGAVLITGGTSDLRTALADAELFLVSTRSFHPWGKMTRSRSSHAAIALDATRVLLLGGSDGSQPLDMVEVFEGLRLRGLPLPFRLRLRREGFQATPLSDGHILIAGGRGPDNPARIPEIVTPTGTVAMRPIPSASEALEVIALGLDEMLTYGPSGYFRYRK